MTETLETPVARPPVPAPPEDAPPGGEPTEQVGSASFADLVRAHYAWERRLADAGADPGQLERLRAEYQEKLRQFEAEEGEILEAYWCIRKPSAVALTEKRRRLQWLLDEHLIRIHRVSNWLMPRAAQKLDLLLQECDELAIRSAEILRGTPKRIALRSIYEVEGHVLAFLERTSGRPTAQEVEEFVADARQTIAAARECYENAADKVARMVYVSGMLFGLVLLVPIAALAGLGLWIFGALHLHSGGTQAFYACLAAGALGAVVSVLSRMGSPAKFGLDPEVGRQPLFFLGAYRPFVGSIFGLALYFLLQSSLLQIQLEKQFSTFVVAAFLGGFSERFVKVMLHGAEKTVGGAGAPAAPADQGAQPG